MSSQSTCDARQVHSSNSLPLPSFGDESVIETNSITSWTPAECIHTETFVENDELHNSLNAGINAPVLDITDPLQLMDLISNGEAFIQDLDASFTYDIDFININVNENISSREQSVNQSVDELFTPKVTTSRPQTTKAKMCTGHKLLTSKEVLEDKKNLQTQKKSSEGTNEAKLSKN